MSISMPSSAFAKDMLSFVGRTATSSWFLETSIPMKQLDVDMSVFPFLANAGLVSQSTVRVLYDKNRRNDPSSFTVFATRGDSVYSAGLRLMQTPDLLNGFQHTRGIPFKQPLANSP